MLGQDQFNSMILCLLGTHPDPYSEGPCHWLCGDQFGWWLGLDGACCLCNEMRRLARVSRQWRDRTSEWKYDQKFYFRRSELQFHQQPLVKPPGGKAKPRGSGGDTPARGSGDDAHGHDRGEGSGYPRLQTVVETIPPMPARPLPNDPPPYMGLPPLPLQDPLQPMPQQLPAQAPSPPPNAQRHDSAGAGQTGAGADQWNQCWS